MTGPCCSLCTGPQTGRGGRRTRTGTLLTPPLNTWYGVTTGYDGRVTALHLDNNNLTGSIPALNSLTRLLYLDLSNNTLSGSIPPLPALIHLDLSANDLSGSVPDISMELPFLQFLDLSHNRFRVLLRLTSPYCLALANFTHFDLSHNQLTGPVPASLGRLGDLTHLDFSHNRLSGPLPGELGGTIDFRCINAAEEEENREVRLEDLTWLDLSNNQLTGPIPPSLGGLSNLTHLDLSHNALIRPIPPTLGGLSNLQTLDLSGNTLSGSIPVSLDSLSILQVLDLSNNTLSGTIPAEVGSLRNLSRLLLGGNTFSGPLPDQLGALSNLVTLTLDSDTGPVPDGRTGGVVEAIGRHPAPMLGRGRADGDRAVLQALYWATNGGRMDDEHELGHTRPPQHMVWRDHRQRRAGDCSAS